MRLSEPPVGHRPILHHCINLRQHQFLAFAVAWRRTPVSTHASVVAELRHAAQDHPKEPGVPTPDYSTRTTAIVGELPRASGRMPKASYMQLKYLSRTVRRRLSEERWAHPRNVRQQSLDVPKEIGASNGINVGLEFESYAMNHYYVHVSQIECFSSHRHHLRLRTTASRSHSPPSPHPVPSPSPAALVRGAPRVPCPRDSSSDG